MEYIRGFNIKPYAISSLGQVSFTDGTTNDIIGNQVQCEAYGYTYDKTSGTCRAFRYNSSLNTAIESINNKMNGAGNTTQGTSNSIQINGTGNGTLGDNNNCFLNGRDNELANNIDNATVQGSMGKAFRQGEIVLGGGFYNNLAGLAKKKGLAQSSKVQLSAQTTDATPTNLKVQDIAGEFIKMQLNSVLGFEIYISKLQTGGSAGTAGNFHFIEIKGAARCDNSGTIILYTYSTTTIASLGLTAVSPAILSDSSTTGSPSISIKVAGLVNTNNQWSATAQLHELRITTTF